MASYSVGISVTWGGSSFSEVTAANHTYGGSRRGRSVAWSGDAGSASVETLGASMVSTSFCGTTGTLVISGGGISLTCPAIYESCGATPELNGVTRYTVNFKLLEQ